MVVFELCEPLKHAALSNALMVAKTVSKMEGLLAVGAAGPGDEFIDD